MVVKEVDLSQEDTLEIQDLNTELVTLKNLMKEMDESSSDFIYNKIFASLKTAQFNYDNWFQKMSDKNKIVTKPDNRWNVDFTTKKLQLLSN